MAGKNYIKGLFIKESKYGLKVSFNVSVFTESIKAIQNEKGYSNTEILKRKEVGQYGDTHYCIEDTFKPDPNYKKQESSYPASENVSDVNNQEDEDSPF
jgi:hypothetical protein